jgi:glycerol-3-phosphate dehydrogenase
VQSRAESVRSLHDQSFDVCVIGGGATGAGCALDAQLRGLRTVLIDAGDFASATSSASTKLAHGGVRYLEQALRQFDLGQFKVVRSALRERVRMLHNAPHLAHSREFVIPCVSRWESFYYGVGVRLYDWLSGSENLAASHVLDRGRTVERFPELSATNLAGSVLYTDGQFDDARYNLALIQSFTDAGGTAGNYLRLVSFERDAGGKLTTAMIEDQRSKERLFLRARLFVNATGPFSDCIRTLARPDAAPRLVLSRGVHILLPLSSPHESVALLIPLTEDGRVIFAIPWLGRLLVGTTDQEVADNREAAVSREEAEYLLRHLNRYLREPRSLNEIVAAFSGVRPLVRHAQAQQTKRLIRDHEVEVDTQSGLISVLGGKWTTYRAMAEDAINHVQRLLPQPVTPSRTAHHPLPGAERYSRQYAAELSARHGISIDQAQHLAHKFGTLADEVCVIAQRDSALRRRVVDGFPAIEAEIAYSIRCEMAATIEDVLARRLGLQFFSWSRAAQAAPKVAQHFVREHGWSDQERAAAVDEYLEKIRRMQDALGLSTQPVREIQNASAE